MTYGLPSPNRKALFFLWYRDGVIPQLSLEGLIKMGVIIEGQSIGDFCHRIFFQEQFTAFFDFSIQY